MAVPFSRPDPTSPAGISSASFPISRKGLDQQAVHDFLQQVAGHVARLEDRIRFLERDLNAARSAVAPAELDEETATRLLGEEAIRILQTARESAVAIKDKAADGAARAVREASDEAQRIRHDADVEAARRRSDAAADADSELAMAKQQGREMVEEARAYRERVLGELARRREVARQQIDQLLHGRDRLLKAFEAARLAAADVVSDLTPIPGPEDLVDLSPTTGPVPTTIATSRDSIVAAADHSAIGDGPYPGANGADVPDAPTDAGSAFTRSTGIYDVMSDDRDVDEPVFADEATDDGSGRAREDGPADGLVDHDGDDATGDGGEPGEDGDDRPIDDTGARPPERSNVVAMFPRVAPHLPTAVDDSADDDDDDDVWDRLAAESGDATGDANDAAEARQDTDPGALDDVDEFYVEEFDADEVEDDEITATDVDALFARLRASRTGGSTAAGTTTAPTGHAADAPAGGVADLPVGDAADATAGDAVPSHEAGLDDDSPFARRDAQLVPLIVASGRKLKRVLADEQNEVLDRLRQREPVTSIDQLVPVEADHARRYADAITSDLLAMAAAGAASVAEPGDDSTGIHIVVPDALTPVDDALLFDLIAPLRDRLANSVDEGDGDNDVIVKRIRAVYREWKTKRIDEQLDDLARMAFGRGAFTSLAEGTRVVWSVDPAQTGCADCEDNSLAGPTAVGTAFPTGHACAPAHSRCRCLLVRAAQQ